MKELFHRKKQIENSAKKSVAVYILAGQSNAVGYSFWKGKKVIFPSVMIYNSSNCENVENTDWTVVKSGQGRDKFRFGPEIGIAEKLTENYEGKDVFPAIVKSALGGKSIYDYFLSPTSVKQGLGDTNSAKKYLLNGSEIQCAEGYFRLIKTISEGLDKLIELGFEPNVMGMFWMQGETDGEIEGAYPIYQTTLKNLLDDIKAFLKKEDLPIVIGKIKSPAPYEKEIISAQESLCKIYPNCYLVDTADLNMQTNDNWHYDTPSMLELGRRFGSAMMHVHD